MSDLYDDALRLLAELLTPYFGGDGDARTVGTDRYVNHEFMSPFEAGSRLLFENGYAHAAITQPDVRGLTIRDWHALQRVFRSSAWPVAFNVTGERCCEPEKPLSVRDRIALFETIICALRHGCGTHLPTARRDIHPINDDAQKKALDILERRGLVEVDEPHFAWTPEAGAFMVSYDVCEWSVADLRRKNDPEGRYEASACAYIAAWIGQGRPGWGAPDLDQHHLVSVLSRRWDGRDILDEPIEFPPLDADEIYTVTSFLSRP